MGCSHFPFRSKTASPHETSLELNLPRWTFLCYLKYESVFCCLLLPPQISKKHSKFPEKQIYSNWFLVKQPISQTYAVFSNACSKPKNSHQFEFIYGCIYWRETFKKSGMKTYFSFLLFLLIQIFYCKASLLLFLPLTFPCPK